MAKVDPDYAKNQLLLMLHERFMSANGQVPGSESNLDTVHPPLIALVCHQVYKITGRKGHRDLSFLTRCFHKLLVNFTW